MMGPPTPRPQLRHRRAALRAGGLLLILGAMLLPVTAAQAHPLGNITVNHYDGLHLRSHELIDHAVVDVAELPTYQRQPGIDRDHDGLLSPDEQTDYATARCAAMGRAVTATLDRTRVPMTVTASSYTQLPGAAGLHTGRLECTLHASINLSRPASLSFANTFDAGGPGWHEITATGDGVALHESPFPAASISDELRRYPNDLLSSPLDVRSGTVRVSPDGTSSYAGTPQLSGAGPVSRLLEKLSGTFNTQAGVAHLSVGAVLLAFLLAALVGAGHAFLPGHGKTLMAAYLIGRRGRVRDLVTVGATVTLTHTLGVLLLGLTLATTTALLPGQLEQALSVASGVLVVLVGAFLLRNHLRGRRRRGPHAVPISGAPAPPEPLLVMPAATEHPVLLPIAVARPDVVGHAHPRPQPQTHVAAHGHPHPHPHAHPHPHSHSHVDGSGHAHDATFGRGGLIGLGVAGGLVPSPSALVVLLGATALGRAWLGVLLVVGYGVGMAAALTAAGLLLLRLRDRLDTLFTQPRYAGVQRLAAVMPLLTALALITVGLALTGRGLAA